MTVVGRRLPFPGIAKRVRLCDSHERRRCPNDRGVLPLVEILMLPQMRNNPDRPTFQSRRYEAIGTSSYSEPRKPALYATASNGHPWPELVIPPNWRESAGTGRPALSLELSRLVGVSGLRVRRCARSRSSTPRLATSSIASATFSNDPCMRSFELRRSWCGKAPAWRPGLGSQPSKLRAVEVYVTMPFLVRLFVTTPTRKACSRQTALRA